MFLLDTILYHLFTFTFEKRTILCVLTAIKAIPIYGEAPDFPIKAQALQTDSISVFNP